MVGLPNITPNYPRINESAKDLMATTLATLATYGVLRLAGTQYKVWQIPAQTLVFQSFTTAAGATIGREAAQKIFDSTKVEEASNSRCFFEVVAMVFGAVGTTLALTQYSKVSAYLPSFTQLNRNQAFVFGGCSSASMVAFRLFGSYDIPPSTNKNVNQSQTAQERTLRWPNFTVMENNVFHKKYCPKDSEKVEFNQCALDLYTRAEKKEDKVFLIQRLQTDALTEDQIKDKLKPKRIKHFTEEQIGALKKEQIGFLTQEQIGFLTEEQIGFLTEEQMIEMTKKFEQEGIFTEAQAQAWDARSDEFSKEGNNNPEIKRFNLLQ